jgi:hypothetical protein
MLRRWLQCVTLALVAALLVGSQCYALCSVSACTPSNQGASHCHQHPAKTQQACQYQHSDIYSPEDSTEIAKLSSTISTLALAVPSVAIGQIGLCLSSVEFVGEVGAHKHLGTNVLAFLSIFRI